VPTIAFEIRQYSAARLTVRAPQKKLRVVPLCQELQGAHPRPISYKSSVSFRANATKGSGHRDAVDVAVYGGPSEAIQGRTWTKGEICTLYDVNSSDAGQVSLSPEP
jgi:hypothetical protein